MPKRTDTKKIMAVGGGPNPIGQSCESDYSGSHMLWVKMGKT
jgi:hypothetical protein